MAYRHFREGFYSSGVVIQKLVNTKFSVHLGKKGIIMGKKNNKRELGNRSKQPLPNEQVFTLIKQISKSQRALPISEACHPHSYSVDNAKCWISSHFQWSPEIMQVDSPQ